MLRSEGQTGYCQVSSDPVVARASLHMWEEPCISGKEGSGTVFFSGCNLRCVFCQNHDISGGAAGITITVRRLADIFIELQDRGANNINLVTGTHFAAKIIDALKLARADGLKLPVVYNTSSYEKPETIDMLAPYVDIWLPDLKYRSSALAHDLSYASDYFDVATEALRAMVSSNERRFGEGAGFDERGIMTHGVIVRHLCLPGHVDDSKRVLRYLHETYGDRIYISIMSQYTPIRAIEGYPELSRKLSRDEYGRILTFAERIGISSGFIQEGEAASESFIPPFDLSGVIKQ